MEPVLCSRFSKQDNQHDLLHVCAFRCDYFPQGPFNLPLTLFPFKLQYLKNILITYHYAWLPTRVSYFSDNCCFCSSSLMSDPKGSTCNSQVSLFHFWMDFFSYLQTFVFWCVIPPKQPFNSYLDGVCKQSICKSPDLAHFQLPDGYDWCCGCKPPVPVFC